MLVITSFIISIRAYLRIMLMALDSVLSRFFRKNVGMTVDIFCMYAKETTLISVLTFENCLESMASNYFSCLGLSNQKVGLAYFSSHHKESNLVMVVFVYKEIKKSDQTVCKTLLPN